MAIPVKDMEQKGIKFPDHRKEGGNGWGGLREMVINAMQLLSSLHTDLFSFCYLLWICKRPYLIYSSDC